MVADGPAGDGGEARSGRLPRLAEALLWLAGLSALHALARANYLLFHGVVELFGVAVACGAFFVAWNTRRFARSGLVVVLGAALLASGAMDLVHALAYEGMGVFPGRGADLPTRLWVAARWLQAVLVLAAAIASGRRVDARPAALGSLSLAALLLASILVWGAFPRCYDEAAGRLTPFKVYSEYAIAAILLLSIAALRRPQAGLEPGVRRTLSVAIGLAVAAELAFTLYTDVTGAFNELGHLLRLLSAYQFYRAIIATGLERPYEILFRDLAHEEERFRAMFEASHDLVSVADEAGRTVWANPAWERTLGYRAGMVEDPLELVHPTDLPRVREAWRAFRRGEGEITNMTYSQRTIRGDHLALETTVRRVEVDGRPHLLTVAHDVTARRRMEEEIRSLARFPAENPSPVMRVDKEGAVVYANEAALSSLEPMGLAVGAKAPAALAGPVAEALADGSARSVEGDVDGRRYLFTLAPVAGQRYANVYGVDVTRLKEAEAAVRRRLELEAAVAAVSSRLVAPPDLGAAVEASLADIGRATGAKCADVFLLTQDGAAVDDAYEWCAPGVPPTRGRFQGVPRATFGWLERELAAHGKAVVEDAMLLPDEAASERALLERQGIRSLLAFPLVVGGGLAGAVAIEGAEPVRWREDDMRLLGTAAELIGGALGRGRAEDELSRMNRGLERRVEERTAEVQRYAQSMEFLSRTALGFAGLGPAEDIFRFAAEELREHLGGGVVLASSFDPATGRFECRAVAGLGDRAARALELVGRDVVGMDIPISDEAREGLMEGRLRPVEGGLHALACGAIPGAACEGLERLLDVGPIHSMGLVRGERLYGSVSIVLPRGLEDPATVEIFVNQASVALQRRQAEVALRAGTARG